PVVTGWHVWSSLGGVGFSRGAGIGSWASGRLDVFSVDGNGLLTHNWFANNAWQPTWEEIVQGPPPSGRPVAIGYGGNGIEAFYESGNQLFGVYNAPPSWTTDTVDSSLGYDCAFQGPAIPGAGSVYCVRGPANDEIDGFGRGPFGVWASPTKIVDSAGMPGF